MAALWVSVEVKSGAKVLQPASILSVASQEETFGSLLGRVSTDFQDRTVEKTVISTSGANQGAHSVPLNAPVVQICGQFGCTTITYYIEVIEEPATASRNAFTVLMASRLEKHLPSKVSGENIRGNQRLFNDLLDVLASMNIGWTRDVVSTVGERCVKVLAGCLWYIDSCHKQFVERSIKLPEVFGKFQGYNNWKQKKLKKPQLSYDGLTFHLDKLSSMLQQPWIFSSAFKDLRGLMNSLAESFGKYRDYLKRQNSSVQMNQASLTPCRTISESLELLPIPIVEKCKADYNKVEEELGQRSMYDPIFANDFAPKDRFQRKNWFTGMKLTIPCMMYRFMHGNNLGTLSFLWKIPASGGEATANAKIVTDLNARQKMFSTRQMRRDYIDRYSYMLKTSQKAVLRNLYRSLTDDFSASRSATEKSVDDRIAAVAEEVLELDEPEILLDLRHTKSPKSSKYNAFWEELALYLDELNPACDDRRHGNILHMPIAISVRNLCDIIVDRLKSKNDEEVSIPSREWVRLQFSPCNPYAANSMRYTGRFEIKYAVQRRQLRKSHPDSKYVMVLLKYAKSYAVLLSKYVILVSVDDKAIVPVGEPGLPINTGVRGRRSLVPTNSFVGALDHDFHLHGVVPSVALVIDLPESPLDSFHRGQVYVSNKNKVTQPSSPLRHSVELSKTLLTVGCEENSLVGSSKPFLMIMSDGGPDHRLSYGSVQVALLCLFFRMNCDVLIAISTCPYQSWTNPAERVMSVLNLALQNTSLARKEMSTEHEHLVKNKQTIKAVRAEIEAHPDLEAGIVESVQSVIDTLDCRFQQLQLKERYFKAGHVASQSEMDDMFDEIVLYVDTTLKKDKLTQAELKKSEALQKFMAEHCHTSKYVFQVRKCLRDSCHYCSSHPVRISTEEYKAISLLPLPLLNVSKDHYRPFADVYGSTPNEKDRPSLRPVKSSEDENTDKANRKLLSQCGKVRAVLSCGDCFKPRCVFSDSVLTNTEKSMLLELEADYTCGSMLFPPSSQFHSSIICRANLSCADDVESQYYSATLVKFPPVCCHCGGPEETLVEDELVRDLKQRKQVVRPICFLCRSDGKEPNTWGASSNKKRKT